MPMDSVSANAVYPNPDSSTTCLNSSHERAVVRRIADCAAFEDAPSGAAFGPKTLLSEFHATDFASARAVSVAITCGWMYVVQKFGGCRQLSLDDVVRGLQNIANLGFHFVEIEAYGRLGANALFEHRHELRDQLDKLGLRALVFSYIDHTLFHTDFRNEARYGLERLQEKGLPTAKALGVECICISSFTPSQAFYVDPRVDPSHSTYYRWPPYQESELLSSQVKLPQGFKMKAAWAALMAGCKIAAELARREGIPLCLRARRRELCETTADLINLCDDVRFSNFYVAMDTALINYSEEFLYAARKLIELPKLPGRLAVIYAADNDGQSCTRHALRDAVGSGGIDWDQFAQLLKEPSFHQEQPFHGPFILEVDDTGTDDLDNCLIASAHRAQSLFTTHGIPWLI